MDPVATVVVVNWNGAERLRRCLPALLDQQLTGGRTFEVVVVDNASSDGSLTVLEEYPAARVIRSRENLGFAAGNNIALREVRTPYVALVNNDAVAQPGWLEALLAPLVADADLAMTTGRVLFDQEYVALGLSAPVYVRDVRPDDDLGVRVHRLTVDGTDVRDRLAGDLYPRTLRFRWTRPEAEVLVPVSGEGPWSVRAVLSAENDPQVHLVWPGGSQEVGVPTRPGTEVDLEIAADAPRRDVVNNAGVLLLDSGQAADRGLLRADGPRYACASDVFGGCGNGLALRTEVGRAVDWFDERYFMYYEDVDLAWRIRARGGRVRYVPEAVLRHEHMGSSGSGSDLHAFHDGRNRLLCLTTNATAATVRREVLAYRRGITPENRDLRRRVLRAYVRMLPYALRRRREVGRGAIVSRADLEALAISKSDWRRGED